MHQFFCELHWFFWYVSNLEDLICHHLKSLTHIQSMLSIWMIYACRCFDFPCFQRELYLVWFRLFFFAVELILLENYFQDEKPKKLWFAWSNLLNYNSAYKRIKKKVKKKKHQKKTRKIEPLNLKNIQNPWNFFFFWKCFARALAQTFLRVMKLISFLRFFLCRNIFQNNFLSRRRNSKIVWKYKTQMPSHTL